MSDVASDAGERNEAGPLITVPVELGVRRYDVVVGPGAKRCLRDLLPPGVRRAAVVTQPGIDFDVDPGIPVERYLVPDGEGAKSLSGVEDLCRRFARGGISRADAVVAVGGGVVTDLAGFAAAVYLRGMEYVNVATTLLAQVDAAIGGKTGVNLQEGKNLVGAFWQPVAVVCDTDALGTLPPREWTSGRGEMAKCAFLGTLLAAAPGGAAEPEPLHELSLEEQIARCVAIKAAAVATDEREGGRRALLNYGHTLAHALEGVMLEDARTRDLRHGEAVAMGIVFAARLAQRLGRIDDERVAAHRKVLDGFELPTELPTGVSARRLLGFMARDKKARHDLTFVLDGPAGIEVVRDVATADVLATLADMGCAP